LSELIEKHDFASWTRQPKTGSNSPALLLFHIAYYQSAQLGVLKGMPLTAKDSESFSAPKWESETHWENWVNERLSEAREMHQILKGLDQQQYMSVFVDPKYGTVWQNLLGLIEHSYYHMGQIRLLLSED
jgi:uncharacterized damage-inducible protein DinB